ncbi:MAG: HU family DNA-binding protein [Neptuniibacter sp.]
MSIISSTYLASRVAMNARLTQSQAEAAIKALGPAIVQTLNSDHAIEFKGFGLFKVEKRQDGSNGVHFIQAKTVREAVNGNA